jgi:thymidylate synthase (FAD)
VNERPRSEALDAILGREFPVLDAGFVRVVDYMGDDEAIVRAARVSYGAGTKTPSDDRTLIRYLMRHRHTTPFEMAELKLHVRVPMDAWRQWIRHRTASVNEYSTRYSEAIDAMHRAHAWRTQDAGNKQGSAGRVAAWPPGYEFRDGPEGRGLYREFDEGEWAHVFLHDDPQLYLAHQEEDAQLRAREAYGERLRFGVAREQARKDLPLSTYTEATWKIDLHNLLHFLALRMDPHAQHEIRAYAITIGTRIVAPWVPHTWAAFEDYRLGAVALSVPEQAVAHLIAAGDDPEDILGHAFDNRRERDEARTKLTTLGLIR